MIENYIISILAFLKADLHYAKNSRELRKEDILLVGIDVHVNFNQWNVFFS